MVSKYKTSGIDPACRSLLAQILLGMLAIATQPQDAPRDFTQQPHPDVKYQRRDLPSVVEAAEHDALRRQGELFPPRRARCDRAFSVVHLITIRQMNDVLGVVGLLIEGEDDRVADDVVNEIGPCGARKSEIGHLDWCRTKCQAAETAVSCMTVKVDSDIDLKIVDEPRNVLVALHSAIDELVKAGRQSRPHVAAVIRAERHPDYFEARAIVPLEQFGDQIGDRMTAEIAGEIRDPDLVVAPDRARSKTLRDGIKAVQSVVLRACEVQRRIVVVAQ